MLWAILCAICDMPSKMCCSCVGSICIYGIHSNDKQTENKRTATHPTIFPNLLEKLFVVIQKIPTFPLFNLIGLSAIYLKGKDVVISLFWFLFKFIFLNHIMQELNIENVIWILSKFNLLLHFNLLLSGCGMCVCLPFGIASHQWANIIRLTYDNRNRMIEIGKFFFFSNYFLNSKECGRASCICLMFNWVFQLDLWLDNNGVNKSMFVMCVCVLFLGDIVCKTSSKYVMN